MSLNQILCVKIPGEGNEARTTVTCRIVDSCGVDGIDIEDWTRLTLLSEIFYEGMETWAKEVFNLELNQSQSVFVVVPNTDDSIQQLKDRFSNDKKMIFLDSRLAHTLLLFYAKFKKISLLARTAWQDDVPTSFEFVKGSEFINEILKVPVSGLYLSVLSSRIKWRDVENFTSLTPPEKEQLNEMQQDVYKVNYLLNKWKSQNIGVTYVEFFEQLQAIGSSIVQSAYDTWLELCHMPLSSKPDLATLNEVYEVFVAVESDVLQSFERVGIDTFVETIKSICNPPEYILREIQSLQSMAGVFEYLRKYWSFSNYQLLMDIVDKHGSDEGKREAVHYRSSFLHVVATYKSADFLQNLYGNLYMSTEKIEILTMLVGLDQDLVLVGNLRHIHSEFAKIFNVHPCLMHITSVTSAGREECNVTFIVCKWIADEFMGIPVGEENRLTEQLHIKEYTLRGQPYKLMMKSPFERFVGEMELDLSGRREYSNDKCKKLMELFERWKKYFGELGDAQKISEGKQMLLLLGEKVKTCPAEGFVLYMSITYQCWKSEMNVILKDELNEFIVSSTGLFEEIDPIKIAKVCLNFLRSNTTGWQVACGSFHAVMRNRYNKIHRQKISNFPTGHVYQILFWGSLSHKFHIYAKCPKSCHTDYYTWEVVLIKDLKELPINTTVGAELVAGLQFAQSLHVDVSDIINRSKFDMIVRPSRFKPRPFIEIRGIIETLGQCDFFRRSLQFLLGEAANSYLMESDRHGGSKLILMGLSVMMMFHHMNNSGYIPENECVKWLRLMVDKEMKSSLVDGLHLLSRNHVIQTFYLQMFQDMIAQNIITQKDKSLQKLVKVFNFLAAETLQYILSHLDLRLYQRNKQKLWTEFFELLVKSYSGEHHFSILKVVLDKFGYEMQGDWKSFILNFLYIDIDGLGNGMEHDKRFRELFQFLQDICKSFKFKELLATLKNKIILCKNGLQYFIITALVQAEIRNCQVLRSEEFCQELLSLWRYNFVCGSLQFSIRSLFVRTSCEYLGVPQNKLEYFVINHRPLCVLGEVAVRCREVHNQNLLDDSDRFFSWANTLFHFLKNQKGKTLEGNYDDISYALNNYKLLQAVASSFGHDISKAFLPQHKIEEQKSHFLKSYKTLKKIMIHRTDARSRDALSPRLDILESLHMPMPTDLLQDVKCVLMEDVLETYGIKFEEDLKQDLDCLIRVSSADSFEASDFLVQHCILMEDISSPCVLLSVNVSLKHLRGLNSRIKSFLSPVWAHKKVWISLHANQLFRLYFDHNYKQCCRVCSHDASQVQVFHDALVKTEETLHKLLSNSDATYEDMTLCGHIRREDFQMIDEHDIENVAVCIIDDVNSPQDCKTLDGFIGLHAFMKFFSYEHLLEKVCNVCTGLDLTGCLEDSDFKQIEQIWKERNSFEGLTLRKATDYVEVIEKCLMLPGTERCIELFNELLHSTEFYHFVRDRYYNRTETADPKEKKQLAIISFRQTIEFVQHQLVNEDYEEQVLQKVLPGFDYILPFMDTEQSFHSLIQQVRELSYATKFEELKVVRENFQNIATWLRQDEFTLKSVHNDLKQVMDDGVFRFREGKEKSVDLYLEFQSGARGKEWSVQEIDDFEQKLGLIDDKKSEGEDIQIIVMQYLEASQCSRKLHALLLRMRRLGYTGISEVMADPICIKEGKEVCCCKVEMAEEKFITWLTAIESALDSCSPLVRFSMLKIMKLYHSMMNQGANIHEKALKLVLDIHVVFYNHDEMFNTLMEHTELFLSSLVSADDVHPIELVGSYLKAILNFEMLEKCYLPKRTLATPTLGGVLYLVPDCSQDELIRLIVGECRGIPEYYDILFCTEDSTEEEIQSFMKRVEVSSQRHMLILEVNNLPYSLQEGMLLQYRRIKNIQVTLHIFETKPSLFREVPGIVIKSSVDGIGYSIMSPTDCREFCNEKVHSDTDVILVYGAEGVGKSHYIKSHLKSMESAVILPIDESFSELEAIRILQQISYQKERCGIYINYTMIHPGDAVTDVERSKYEALRKRIGWFIFKLVLLGYVEDYCTGESFFLRNYQGLKLFIEVPNTGTGSAEESLKSFIQSDVPVLGLVGNEKFIDPLMQYDIDDDARLVYKYMKAYKTGRINTLYMEDVEIVLGDGKLVLDFSRFPTINKLVQQLTACYIPHETIKYIVEVYQEKSINTLILQREEIKFSTDRDPNDRMCWDFLKSVMPENVIYNKIRQKLFIGYMARRFKFIEKCYYFTLNPGVGHKLVQSADNKVVMQYTNTILLGKTLIEAMLMEVDNMISQESSQCDSSHQQLIYDVKGGGGSFHLISMKVDRSTDSQQRFKRFGVDVLPERELHSVDVLKNYLCIALFENSLLSTFKSFEALLNDNSYILTLDFVIKMLKIHERRECKVPVVIEGETGVGKTALIEMLSQFWNLSWMQGLKECQREIEQVILKFMPSDEKFDEKLSTLKKLESVVEKRPDSELLGSIWKSVHEKLKIMPYVRFLDISKDELTPSDYERLMQLDEHQQDWEPDDVIRTLECLMTANSRSLFYKIEIHAGLSASYLSDKFMKICEEARLLKSISAMDMELSEEARTLRSKFKEEGRLTVYLDEVNTSSCSGLVKEIIIDGSFGGKELPDNVFIIAACNPHRASSIASREEQTQASKQTSQDSYYVRRLNPSLELIKWDFGALDEYQENQYITAKLESVSSSSDSDFRLCLEDIPDLAQLIVGSQEQMRSFAYNRIRSAGWSEEEAIVRSKSCVSQRDIQRVFTFYKYLLKFYNNKSIQESRKAHGFDTSSEHRRAMLVSLGLVYYLRLNTEDRLAYQQWLDSQNTEITSKLMFSDAFQDELNWLINSVELPTGIAKTEALKENIFAAVLCSITTTPLIIEGAPGSSKTLSLNLVVGNIKGKESIKIVFRNPDIFPYLRPFFYQCSRRTTSVEVETVFKRAINQQVSERRGEYPTKCVVCMDEAGLPERTHESLKVLHYYLDKPKVSFIAITNDPLDASKSNRAINLYRSRASKEDLNILAKDCLGLDEVTDDVKKFCCAYSTIMDKDHFSNYFGLRDFIYFLIFLRKHSINQVFSDKKLILRALERNFGGVEEKQFQEVCSYFLKDEVVEHQNWLEVISESLSAEIFSSGSNFQTSIQSDVRYKLIIESSEDDSLIRQLFNFGLLKEKKESLRIYVCSELASDRHAEIGVIAKIRHSALQGHTIVMCQTDRIHESFYDLFNQRFRTIPYVEGETQYFVNIALGAFTKLSRVDPRFQCIILLKRSELDQTPAPFLNRFEKYAITHESLLEIAMNYLPPCLRIVVNTVYTEVKQFVDSLQSSQSLYGYLSDTTLASLFLSLLPTSKMQYKEVSLEDADKVISESVSEEVAMTNKAFIISTLLCVLKQNGFRFFVDPEAVDLDIETIFGIIEKDDQFKRLIETRDKSDIISGINEAFQMLFEAASPQERPTVEIFPDACLMISVLQQWMIRHLCKRLLQILTPEGMAVNYVKVPRSYREVYFKYQDHFNLRNLVMKSLKRLDNVQESTDISTKLICFTRSSHLIDDDSQVISDSTLVLHDVTHVDPDKVLVCKFTQGVTQDYFEKLIKDFISDPSKDVFLFVASMHGLQRDMKKIINHVRIIIESEESQIEGKKSKLFVLLVHFPPVMFFKACYPTIFLNGWDHHYLDSLCPESSSYSQKKSINIHDWSLQFCLPSNQEDSVHLSSLKDMLGSLLYQAVPMIVSQMIVTHKPGAVFNAKMDGYERSDLVQRLLGEYGVGELLVGRFSEYWGRREVNMYIRKAALYTYTNQSRLNLSDSIHFFLRSLFFEFLVYMLSWMNTNCGIEIFFDSQVSKPESDLMKSFFLQYLKEVPLPPISALDLQNLKQHKDNSVYSSLMPFSFDIFSYVEDIAVKCLQEAHMETSDDEAFDSRSVEGCACNLATRSYSKIIGERKSKCLEIFCNILTLNEVPEMMLSLWDRYLSDFIQYKLLTSTEVMFMKDDDSYLMNVLQEYFSPLKQERSVLHRIIALHIHIKLNHLHLARIVSTLHSVNQFFSKAEDGCKFIRPMAQHGETISCRINDLAAFIATDMFNALAVAIESEADFHTWYEGYFSMITIPGLFATLHKELTSQRLRNEFSIMHTVFLVSQASLNYRETLPKIREMYHQLMKSQMLDVSVWLMIEAGITVLKDDPRLDGGAQEETPDDISQNAAQVDIPTSIASLLDSSDSISEESETSSEFEGVNLADFIAAATGSPESRSSLGENDLNMEHEVQPTVVPDDVVETDSVQVQSAEETDDRSQNAEGNDLDAETDDRSQSAEGNDLDAETDDRSQSAEGNNLDAESEAQPNTITITDNVVLPPAPDSVEMLSGEDSSECSEGNDFDVESDALPLSSTMIDVPNCIQIFLEEVMEFTFSVHRGKSSISDGDVSWLLHLTNRTLHLSDIDISFTQNVVYDHINFNMCKYHLSRILLSASESGSEEKLEYGLSVCPIQEKEKVGAHLLIASSSSSSLLATNRDIYVPQFYMHERFRHFESIPMPESLSFNQPLAHAYFEILLEYLFSKDVQVTELLQNALKLTAKLNGVSAELKAVLLIEKQVIIQGILYVIAKGYHVSQGEIIRRINSLRVMGKLNELLKESMIEGHALSFAYNLYNSKKGTSIEHLTKILFDEDGLRKELTCLESLHELSPEGAVISDYHMFPFLTGESNDLPLQQLYADVYHYMYAIHQNRGSRDSLEQFSSFSQKWFSNDVHKVDGIDDSHLFEMVVWLCTYYRFFCCKVTSVPLAKAIFDNKNFRKPVSHLIAAFLDHSNFMICKLEQHLPAGFDPDGGPLPQPEAGERKSDPIFELFTTNGGDSQLRHAIANLVAAVVGLPTKSNHLWYHMFEPKELQDTYMVGFMYSRRVSVPFYYDCGVDFLPDGTYGRLEYLFRMGTSALVNSLHSLYVALWANFACFCIGMLTQPEAESGIKGRIISGVLPVRHYCLSQLNKQWLHMQSYMQMSSLEELSFFIMKLSQQLLQYGWRQKEHMRGIISRGEDLCQYENLWHYDIITDTKLGLKESFAEHRPQLKSNEFLFHLDCMGQSYPQFTTENDMRHFIEDSQDKQSEAPMWSMLRLLIDNYSKLEAIGSSLPELVEFYKFVFCDLAHTVSKEEAFTTTIKEKVNNFVKQYESCDHLPTLYRLVFDGYNKYLKLIGTAAGAGACAKQNKMLLLTDDTALYHFLSTEGNNWLHLVITEEVKLHNECIKKFSALFEKFSFYFGVHHLKSSDVHLMELSRPSCIVCPLQSRHPFSHYLRLVRRRSCRNPDGSISFDLELLGRDMVVNFLLGKPFIAEPIPHFEFVFKVTKKPLSLMDHVVDDTYVERLGSEFMKNFEISSPDRKKLIQNLEMHFHTSSYEQLVNVESGLNNICKHLYDYLKGSKDESSPPSVCDKTLVEFLSESVYNSRTYSISVMEETGVKGLQQSQLEYLGSIKVSELHMCTRCFITWIEEGYYNYCDLPIGLKKRLSEEDQKKVESLHNCEEYTGSLVNEQQLQCDYGQLIDALAQSEKYLEDSLHQNSRHSIMELIQETDLLDSDNKLPDLIPFTIVIEQYVYFRMALQRMQNSRKISMKDEKFHVQRSQIWREPDVSQLWKEHLTHMKRQQMPENMSISTGEESDVDWDDMEEEVKVEDPAPEEIKEDWEQLLATYSCEDVITFLTDTGINKAIPKFKEEGIDGELLLAALGDEAVFKEVSSNPLIRAKIRNKIEDYVITHAH